LESTAGSGATKPGIGLAFVISVIAGYALDHLYNLGRLQTIGAMLPVWKRCRLRSIAQNFLRGV
jgi:hypothetical protein